MEIRRIRSDSDDMLQGLSIQKKIIIIKISSMLHRGNKVIQDWSNMRVSK